MELGFMEMVVIALLIIVLFGPNKLPTIARDLGTGVRKMRGAMEDIKTEIMREADNPVSEIKREIEKVKEAAKDYNPMTEINQELNQIKNSVELQPSTVNPEKKPSVKSVDDDSHEGPVSR
ncbi:Sec-independent protein translocase protein TatB [Chryseobacterium taklimakanense]|uniref:Sec-independent protein translocase protein TatB n=1 Tax=Chryseobacterium taklimakanense TaxID=536441 RepID=UPI001EF4D6A1|nr:Sec-independent protein translocase protein TatB [Chryseobacterium taklimakanense]MCG7280906.1 Sec-independent protein translocase protein TatB [Chryseobacterium taklimakanense]